LTEPAVEEEEGGGAPWWRMRSQDCSGNITRFIL
jgi:hypothetical protein